MEHEINLYNITLTSSTSGQDCIGCAKTGSGKTAAFALPILHKLSDDPYGIFALVLTPTRLVGCDYYKVAMFLIILWSSYVFNNVIETLYNKILILKLCFDFLNLLLLSCNSPCNYQYNNVPNYRMKEGGQFFLKKQKIVKIRKNTKITLFTFFIA